MNTCGRSGYLVDSRSRLPADATTLFVEGLPIVGCTRLHCESCGADVRNAPGIGFRSRADVSRRTFEALYDIEDLASSPLLEPTHADFRLYVCRCSRWLESSAHACRELDPDVLTDPQMPWRCAGHPAVELPHDIEGVKVGSNDELRELAIRGFHGFVPPATPTYDADRANWLNRLRTRLGEGLRGVIDTVALASLEDADAKARGRAIRYVRVVGGEMAARRLLDLVSADRSTYAGVVDEVTDIAHDTTLEESMWRVIARLATHDSAVRERLRAEALSGRAGRSVFSAIARDDTAWLPEHIDGLGRAAGRNVEALLKSLLQMPPKQPLTQLEERAQSGSRPRQ